MIDARELSYLLREALRRPEELLEFIRIDGGDGRSMDPLAVVRDENVARADLFGERLLLLLNTYSRRYRGARFHEQLTAGWDGLRVVSEGDSWFQYPFLLRDVVDHLADRHAVLSLGQAGDTLTSIVAQREREIFPELDAHRPHFLLISGGGNDMVGDGRLATLVGPYRHGRPARDYAHTPAFDAFITDLVALFRGLFIEILKRHPDVHIILHGYDAPMPRLYDDPWLGEPLRARGIRDQHLQAEVMVEIMDRYNAELARLADGFERVHHVNCRGCLGRGDWHDAMHPNNQGFAQVAARIEQRMLEIAAADALPVRAA